MLGGNRQDKTPNFEVPGRSSRSISGNRQRTPQVIGNHIIEWQDELAWRLGKALMRLVTMHILEQPRRLISRSRVLADEVALLVG